MLEIWPRFELTTVMVGTDWIDSCKLPYDNDVHDIIGSPGDRVIPSMALVVTRGITLIKLSNSTNMLSCSMFVFGTVANYARR